MDLPATLPPRVRRKRQPKALNLRPLPPPSAYVLPGGMVQLAVEKLGARLVWVQPEPTSDSVR